MNRVLNKIYNDIKLGVNIDHFATLRNARGENFPSVIEAALIAESNGATSIVSHLREDRRHIKDNDVYQLKNNIKTNLNLEMALRKDVIDISFDVLPSKITLVPERREEVTTEGGLDVKSHYDLLQELVPRYNDKNIEQFLFIAPDINEIDLCAELGVTGIELHTGEYANSKSESEYETQRKRIEKAARYAVDKGLKVAAGHGLDYHNVLPIAQMNDIYELNIGFAIVARALFVGFPKAVNEMLNLMRISRFKK